MRTIVGVAVLSFGLLISPPVLKAQKIGVTQYKYVVTRVYTSGGQQKQDTFTKFVYVTPDGRSMSKYHDPEGDDVEVIYSPQTKIAITLNMTRKTARRIAGMGEGRENDYSGATYLGTGTIQGEACKGYRSVTNGIVAEVWTIDDPAAVGLHARLVLRYPNGNQWSENLEQVTRSVSVPADAFEIPSGFQVAETTRTGTTAAQ